MMRNWIPVALGEIVEFVSDKVQVASLSVGNYISTENMLPDKGGVVAAEKLPASGNVNEFACGDILFSNIRTYFKKVWYANMNGGASPDVIIFRAKDETLIAPRFLYHVLSSDEFIGSTVTASKGTKMPRGDKEAMRGYKLMLPPPTIQCRIAGILSTYDELIENNQRRIRILEDMARSLYREWFVLFRYPGHESVPLVDSPLGQIPQGWKVKKLSDIAAVNRSQINAKTAPDELYYIDIASVSPGQIDYVTTYAFTDAPGRARRVVQHGDVLWSCVRPNRRSHALVMHPETNTIASTGFAVLTAKTVPFTFLYFATTTDDFVSYLTNNASGAAYPAVTATTFEKAELLIPSSALLERFGEATITMTEQAHILKRQTENLRRTRDLLLPRLLSGQIDIEATEILIEEAIA